MEVNMVNIKSALVFVRDIAISAGVIIILLVCLFIYTGNWPPLVVIESNSMQHGDDSNVGVIDTGDLVLVKEIEDADDLVTYIEGRSSGHRTYGDYGDVIIFRKNGQEGTPVIHRSVMYFELNDTDNNTLTFDVPTLARLEYGVDWTIEPADTGRWWALGNEHTILIHDYGYDHIDLRIKLSKILKNCFPKGDLHGGYITLGDHNRGGIDQGALPVGDELVRPIKEEWMIGKARGEIPWMGVAKLYLADNPNPFPPTSVQMFILTIVLVLCLPLVLSYGYGALTKAVKRKWGGAEKDLPEAGTTIQGPSVDVEPGPYSDTFPNDESGIDGTCSVDSSAVDTYPDKPGQK